MLEPLAALAALIGSAGLSAFCNATGIDAWRSGTTGSDWRGVRDGFKGLEGRGVGGPRLEPEATGSTGEGDLLWGLDAR